MKMLLYARVSKDDMFCENQKRILLEWAKREGVEYEYYQDELTTRKTRPEKEKVLKKFREGGYGGVAVGRIDRWARSLQELVLDVEGIIDANGRFVSIGNGFDFQKKSYNASQQLMLNIFASFAQFEREIIRERTNEGLARTYAQGTPLGRHPKECGCGIITKIGKKHEGYMKPIRDDKNRVIGWQDTRAKEQTPPASPPQSIEEKPKTE